MTGSVGLAKAFPKRPPASRLGDVSPNSPPGLASWLSKAGQFLQQVFTETSEERPIRFKHFVEIRLKAGEDGTCQCSSPNLFHCFFLLGDLL